MTEFAVPFWAWIAFTAFVGLLLAFDLGVVGKYRMTPKRSLWLTAFYVVLGLLFSGALYWLATPQITVEYLSGYVIEKSLSLDNIFMFIVIFRAFSIPEEHHHKVLFWGILGAIVMRGLLIAAGVTLVREFEWVLYIFGAFLIFSGGRMLAAGRTKEWEPKESRIYKFAERRFRLTSEFEGGRFFTRQAGERRGTPLLAALILIEATDLLFAFDSIPAIFSVTRDAFVIWTSNIFAILGLRALYFAVRHVVERFYLLERALSLVLVLIGLKIIVGHFVHMPIWVAPVATIVVVTGAIVVSLVRSAGDQKQDEAAERMAD